MSNIFRLNLFDERALKRTKKNIRSPRNPLSKKTVRERERVKKHKRLSSRRKEEHKKKKIWREYLVKLGKGRLAKGEKPPF